MYVQTLRDLTLRYAKSDASRIFTQHTYRQMYKQVQR